MKRLIFILTGLVFLTLKNQSQTVTDYDGNVYDTVIIGSQAWLKQNLRVTHYNNGIPIPNVTDDTKWAAQTTGARCYYNNDSVANDSVYGPLYNWYAVTDTGNICPSGWHVSSNAEWSETEAYLGGNGIAGGRMKEAGTLHWLSPNTGATNSTGFTGLPGGMRDPVNHFRNIHENGLWWTATAYNSSMAWSTYMWYLYAGIDHNPGTKKYGFGIRCVKDISTGMGNNQYHEKINVYPNPAGSMITIEYAALQNMELFVYDLFGKMIMKSALTNNHSEIDIRSLANGAYILKINCGRETFRKKLLKK